MPLSREAKDHAATYQKENFSSLSTLVPKETGDAFKAYCRDRGLSVHATLKAYVEQCIQTSDK